MSSAVDSEVSTLVDLFEASCRRRGDAPLFGTRVGAEFQWTSYAEVHRRVGKMRQLLVELGVQPGDRVALVADNCEEWAVICYATLGCGAILVPLYTAQHAADWQYILSDSKPRVLFMHSAKVGQTLATIRDTLSIEHIIAIDDVADGSESLSSRLAALKGAPSTPTTVNPDDAACYIYTSGTMGRPKGVILSHRNIVFNVTSSVCRFPLTEADRTLAFLPWAHAFGQTADLHVMVYVGCQIAINNDVSALLSNLSLARPTILVAVPRIFNRLYDVAKKQIAARPRAVRWLVDRGIAAANRRANGQRLSATELLWVGVADKLVFRRVRARFGGRLRFVISGSAALSRDVAEFVNAVGINFYEGYGLSEAAPIVSINTPSARRFGTVGKPNPGISVRIDTSVSPDPSVGEIIVSGPSVMRGYRGLPTETAHTITPSGELRTGDLGRIDDDGYLIVTGRLKEQFKLTNGKYVTPSPIEEQVNKSALIANCMLYGANQPYCVLVVVPDPSELARVARSRGIKFDDVASDRAVYRLLKQDVASLTTEFTNFARPRKLLILDDDFTIENGLLTPSQKVRRHAVVNKYKKRLHELYDEECGVELSAN